MNQAKGVLIVFLGIVAISSGFQSRIKTGINEYGKNILNQKILQQKLAGNVKDFDPNIFIDNVCQLVDEMILALGLDPYEFAQGEFLGATYDAWIGGYSSIARLGDASIITADNTMDITVELEMTNLFGNFSFSFDVLGVTISGGATGTIANVDMKLALRFVLDPATGYVTPYVDDFQIITIGEIEVEVFGLGPFDYLADLVADFIVNLIKYLLPFLLDDVIQGIIQQVLDDIFAHPLTTVAM